MSLSSSLYIFHLSLWLFFSSSSCSFLGEYRQFSDRGWDLAEWFERLTANAGIATVHGFDPSILRHSGIWGAATDAVLQKVLYNEKPRKSPLIFRNNCSLFNLRVDYCLEPALADCNMSAWGNSPHQTKILWDFPLKGKHNPLTESIPFYKNPFIPLSDQPREWGGILTLKVVCRKI